jgi:hypothetical protein
MKPFLLAIAFMAFAAPVMAERGAGSDLQKQGGPRDRAEGR